MVDVFTEVGVSCALMASLAVSEIVVPFTIKPSLVVPKLAVGPLSILRAVAAKLS